MSYEAFQLNDTGTWESVGRFSTRRAAKKAAGREGAVVFYCAPRCFLSSAPYLMGRATIDLLRALPGLEGMTV